MYGILLFTLIMACMTVKTSCSEGSDQDISLVNYVIFLHKVRSARIITNWWSNSFLIQLPKRDEPQLTPPSIVCMNTTRRGDPVLTILTRQQAC